MRSALLAAAGLCLASAGPPRAAAQDVAQWLTSIERYLMDEAAEIVLATSAGPPHLAADATVLVLRRDGLHEARRGTNGFTCLVERSWSSPIGPHRDFFNPALRAPICYNAEAARTILGDYRRRTELALAGRTIAEIGETIAREVGTGRLPGPRGVALSYMLSPDQRLGTTVGRFKPHVMFYVPYATDPELGGNDGRSDLPVIFEHGGGPLAAIVIPVPGWSRPVPPPGSP